jgi:hypothetical protein
VPVYGSGGFTSYDDGQTREQLAGWVEKDHIPRVKIKIGESWGAREDRDLERVALARAVIGPDTELYVDANGGYGVGQAVRVAARMAESGVSWFEEPVSSQDLAGLAAVRRQVLPDVAAGEYSWSLAGSIRRCGAPSPTHHRSGPPRPAAGPWRPGGAIPWPGAWSWQAAMRWSKGFSSHGLTLARWRGSVPPSIWRKCRSTSESAFRVSEGWLASVGLWDPLVLLMLPPIRRILRHGCSLSRTSPRSWSCCRGRCGLPASTW